MSDLKKKRVYQQELQSQSEPEVELTAQQRFESETSFVPVDIQDPSLDQDGVQIEQVIRPSKNKNRIGTVLLTAFTGLLGWQAVASVYQAWQQQDWLSLGWTGLITAVASLGVGALGKELWKLHTLRHHFDIQQQSEELLQSDGIGKGKSFCQQLAKEGGVLPESPAYDRWINTISATHSDGEVVDMYDAMVVSEQDKRARDIVTKHATESALLVAVSPLALADMLLVAWRNLAMINQLAKEYGIELGYWSRLKLFKNVLANMAFAGVSEAAVDAGMDLMSMDLAGKVSARAGQGVGVGILTARLGLKAMGLLRPIPWKPERAVKLSAIRKQIVSKITSVTVK
ncbi:YcjF family protein [Vibrio olivae]|uniref:YcjF family protein n=1 Tax=Vibrio olivae TaxID=1243002 RepID=A0ABV5HI66_9VIBR